MSSLPVFKLTTLLVKQVAKPIASRIKLFAQEHPQISDRCEWLGQNWHQVSKKIHIRWLGHKTKGVKPLKKSEAIAQGADIIGESFVYSVSASLIFVEVWRRDAEAQVKAQKKATRQEAKARALEQRFADLSARLDMQEKQQQSIVATQQDLVQLLMALGGAPVTSAVTKD